MASSRRLPTSYNVSTYGTASRDYSALMTWEAATDNDLVTATKGEVLECYDDETKFIEMVQIQGAITNSSYFRVIKPATGEGHDGTPNNGFTIELDDRYIDIQENYSQLHDLVILDATISSDVGIFLVGEYTAAIGCIIKSTDNKIPRHFQSNGSNIYFINCISIGASDRGFYGSGDNNNIYFYNCIAVDANIGFELEEGCGNTGYAKNCITHDCTTDFKFTTWTKTTCYEGDATVFKDQPNDDYHLASADTTCRGNGTDLSADANYAFDDDIDGETRSAWDIGADEYSASGWAGKILGVTGIAKINGIAVADIAKVMGV